MAETYYLLRKPDEAMTRINEVLALNPDFAQAHVVKGKILEELHRYHEAEDEFVESVSPLRRGKHVSMLSAATLSRSRASGNKH